MKWLLPAVFLMHTAAQAQQIDLETEKLERYRAELGEQRESTFDPVADLRYSWGYILAHPAGLYWSMATIKKGIPAFRLKPGDRVFLVSEKKGARWLKVARHTYQKTWLGHGPGPDTDTVVYYMRASAVVTRNRLIQSFRLH